MAVRDGGHSQAGSPSCLSHQGAAEERGEKIGYDEAREIVYGMPYAEWKAKHQTEASAEQKAAFEKAHPDHH